MNMRRVWIPRVFAMVLLALASRPLHAQRDATELVSDIRIRDSIRQIMLTTQAKGIPVEPLASKVREGIAKRAEPSRIQSAVQLLAERLEASYRALTPTISLDEVSAGVSALQAGVPAPTLRDLRKLWPTRALTVPLGVLTELVAHGVPTPQATARVRELMQRGASNSQLVMLGTRVQADVASGIAPDAALELRARGVISLLVPPIQTTIVPKTPPIRP